MTARIVVFWAGLGLLFLAVLTQGILPAVQPQSRYTKVTKVVRTDLGELKWITGEATPYTALEQQGRQVYLRDGCWYCHSQYVRPVTGETRRWGPVSQVGEYAFDNPHLLSTRRIGPDLTRVGEKYSDGWHYAHYWNPRMLYRDSIMPRYSGLFLGPTAPVKIMRPTPGNCTLDNPCSLERNALTESIFDFRAKQPIYLTPDTDGLAFVSARGRTPVVLTPNGEYAGESIRLLEPSDDLRALVAYVQKLGMNRGKWRDVFEPQAMQASLMSVPKSDEWIDYGKEVYERRCIGCHGAEGDGNGPAATFLEVRPRNFRLGEFKFRFTPSGSLPTDGDLYQTISRGLRGTAMPTWHMLPEKDRLAVIQYVKYRLAIDGQAPGSPSYFEEQEPEAPIHVGEPPTPSATLVARGNAMYTQAKCWECHGESGDGNGPKADSLRDDFGFPIRPANFVAGVFKSGPRVQDIFRTMSTGINGTPMPSYGDVLSENDEWAISYYVLSFSAFRAPVTGTSLHVARADRVALDDPRLRADSSATAYASARAGGTATLYAGQAYARRHDIELVGAKAGDPHDE